MTVKLSQEVAEALDASSDGSVEVVNPNNNRTYVIVDGDMHRQAMNALRRQRQQEDRDAIAEGIAQMEAGEGIPLDEAFEEIRAKLNLPRRQQ